MSLETGNSLHWKTSIDNAGLRGGANEAVNIISNMAASISRINPFAVIGVAAAAAFAKASVEATKFSVSVTEAMKEVETISRAVHGSFDQYYKAIVDMSREIPESADRLAKAYYQVVSAGYDGTAGLQLLETASRAAVAGVTDTFTAVDGLTTVLNAFKLEAADATHVSDVLFTTVRLGKTTFPELANEMAYVAPIAAANGIAFEQVAAAIATLTKQGMQTSMAMRYLRGAIIQMNKALGDGWQETMTLQEAMQKIYEMAGGSQTKMQELLGSIEALNAVLAMTGGSAGAAAKDLQEFADVTGASADAVEIMQDKLSYQATLLKNNMLAALRPIGDGIQDFLIDRFKEANRVLGLMVERQREYTEEYALSKLSTLEGLIQEPPRKFDRSGSAIAGGMPEMEYMSVEERAKAIRDMGVEIDNLEEKLTLYDQLKTAYTGTAERQKILNEITDAARDVFFGVSQDADAAAESVKRFNEVMEAGATGSAERARSYEERNKYKLRDMERLIEREKEIAAQYGTLPEQFTRDAAWQQDYAARMAAITEREAEKNRLAMFQDMFEDFRRMNEDELREYERFLQEKLALDEWNADEKIALLERLDQVQAEIYDRELEKLRSIGDAINSLGDLISHFDADLGDTVQQVSGMVREAASLGENVSTGNYIGAFADSVSLLSQAISLFDDSVKEMAYWQNISDATGRSISMMRSYIGEASGVEQIERIQSVIADLKAIQQNQDPLIRWEKLPLEDQQAIRESIASYESELQRTLTGTTAESISSAIRQGFEDGKSAIDIFAESFEDVMRNALMNTFEQSMITRLVQPFYDMFYEFSEDGLTSGEIGRLRAAYAGVVYGAEGLLENFRDIAPDLFEGTGTEQATTALSGQIKQSITEDTAGLIEGQMRGMRMDMADMLSYMDRHLTAVNRIRDNTEFNRRYLPTMNGYLSRIANSGVNVRAIGG